MKILYIHENTDGSYRKATTKEIKTSLRISKIRQNALKKIEKLQTEVKEIDKKCKHIVSYDEEGYMYDIRYCLTCGKSSIL